MSLAPVRLDTVMLVTMHDLIGDIHGHADELEALLRGLGYARRGGVFLCAYRWDGEQVLDAGKFVRSPDR